MKTLVLVSGGLDSTVLLYSALRQGHEVQGMFFDYEQPAMKQEFQAIINMPLPGDIVVPLNTVELTKLGGQLGTVDGANDGDTLIANYVPNRNAIFLSHAFGFAWENGFDQVGFATHAGFGGGYFPDTSPQFCDRFQHLMNIAIPSKKGNNINEHIRLWTPYLYWRRGEIIQEGQRLEVPFDSTWSCYKSGDKPCGQCGACIDRQKGFEQVNS